MIFSLPLICLSFFVCKYVKWSAFSQLCSLIFYIYILKGVISEVLNIVECHFNNNKLARKWKVIGVYLLVKPHWCVWFNHHGYYTLSHVYQLVWKWLLNSKQLHNSPPINNMRKPLALAKGWKNVQELAWKYWVTEIHLGVIRKLKSNWVQNLSSNSKRTITSYINFGTTNILQQIYSHEDLKWVKKTFMWFKRYRTWWIFHLSIEKSVDEVGLFLCCKWPNGEHYN